MQLFTCSAVLWYLLFPRNQRQRSDCKMSQVNSSSMENNNQENDSNILNARYVLKHLKLRRLDVAVFQYNSSFFTDLDSHKLTWLRNTHQERKKVTKRSAMEKHDPLAYLNAGIRCLRNVTRSTRWQMSMFYLQLKANASAASLELGPSKINTWKANYKVKVQKKSRRLPCRINL